MRKKLLFPVLGILMLMLPDNSSAQDFTKRMRYTTFGVNLSAANYYGDLTPGPSVLSTDPALTRPNIGVYALRKFYPRVSGRVSFSWSRIKGADGESAKSTEAEDGGRWQRNQSFRNDIKELSVVGLFDILPNYGFFVKRNEYTPYVFAGVAMFLHNPQTYYGGNLMKKGWYDLQPLQTEGKKYSKAQVSIPFGIGIRCKLSQQLDLGFEIGWRRTFTDYLDDVSTNYLDKGTLDSEHGTAAWVLSDRSLELEGLKGQQVLETGANGQSYPATGGVTQAGMQRGDKTMKDWYILTGFTFSYTLEEMRKSPKFR
jgi:hypothetical protein